MTHIQVPPTGEMSPSALPAYGMSTPVPGPGSAPGVAAPESNMAIAVIGACVAFALGGILAVWAGIIAIVNANNVAKKWSAGDFNGAELAARRAKGWAIGAMVLGAVVSAVVVMLLVATSATTGY